MNASPRNRAFLYSFMPSSLSTDMPCSEYTWSVMSSMQSSWYRFSSLLLFISASMERLRSVSSFCSSMIFSQASSSASRCSFTCSWIHSARWMRSLSCGITTCCASTVCCGVWISCAMLLFSFSLSIIPVFCLFLPDIFFSSCNCYLLLYTLLKHILAEFSIGYAPDNHNFWYFTNINLLNLISCISLNEF